MTALSLHCLQCAFIATTGKDGIQHVHANPSHTVTGPGADEDTTITISIEKG